MRALATTVALLLTVPAFAQEVEIEQEETPPAEPEKKPTGVDLTPDEDGVTIPDPNLPDREMPVEEVKRSPRHRYTKDDFPLEVVQRPLTLPQNMAEITLELPFSVAGGDPTLAQLVRGGFGVTRDLQVGLTYAFGLLRLSAPEGANTYEVGKAVSIDGAYTIVPDWLAAQLRLGFHFDPDLFGFSFTVGAPLRVRVMKNWIFYGLNDLLTVKIAGMPVYPESPEQQLASLAVDALGGETSSGSIDLTLGTAYQVRPDLAASLAFVFHWPDFSADDQPISLWLGASYTPMPALDLGARIGFARLDESDSFGISVFGSYRL